MTIQKQPVTKTLKLVSPKQKRGADFEAMALHFLEQQGLTLLHKNWLQLNVGEIDLIMLENIVLATGQRWMTVVFVEVRVRQRGQYGDAFESITKGKQRKLSKTATHFLQQHPEYQHHDCRFDVIGYDLNPTPVSPPQHTQQQTTPSSSAPLITPLITPEWIQSAFLTSAW